MKFLSYEIYQNSYTTNSLSAYCFWIKKMGEHIGGFLKSFLLKLNQYKSNMDLSDILIKLSIIYSSLLERKDLHEEIIEISTNIFNSWDRLQPLSKWQCLRYFAIYTQMMNKNQICAAFSIFMNILCKDPPPNISLYSECQQILNDFIQSSKVKKYLSENIG